MLTKVTEALVALKNRLFPQSVDSILGGLTKKVTELEQCAARQEALVVKFNREAEEADRKSGEAFAEAMRAAAVKQRFEALLG